MNSPRVVKIGLAALATLALILGFLSNAVPLEVVSLPDPATTGTGSHYLHIILPDDMMITMRVSKFFLAHGYPGYNLSNLSQPATSYLWPILLAPVFFLLPDNAALTVVVLLGIACMAGSTCLIVRSRRTLDAPLLLLVAAVLLNATTISYLYTGWEYLPETFVCALCCYEALRRRPSLLRSAGIGVCGAIAVLLRIDAALLVIPVVLTYAIREKGARGLLAIACAAALLSFYAVLQWHWFHNFFPTTARLKADYLVPASYQVRYWRNALFAGTAVGFIPVMICSHWQPLLRARPIVKAMIAGAALTYGYAFLVSDVFFGARMLMAPLVITALAIASLDTVATPAPGSDARDGSRRLADVSKAAYALLFLLSLYIFIRLSFEHRIQTPLENSSSNTAQQLALAQYLKAKLAPEDGAVGLFFLGTAGFALQEFEIADFLGKADEQIARLKPKWGPPGHNKWDIASTLSRWNPAVIVSNVPLPVTQARARLNARASYSFTDDLATSAEVGARYHFCLPYDGFIWGLFVRNDLYPRLADSCRKFQTPD